MYPPKIPSPVPPPLLEQNVIPIFTTGAVTATMRREPGGGGGCALSPAVWGGDRGQ